MKSKIFLSLVVLGTVLYLTIFTAIVTNIDTGVQSDPVALAVILPEEEPEEIAVQDIVIEEIVIETVVEDNLVFVSAEAPIAGFALATQDAIEAAIEEKEEDDLYWLAKVIHCEAGVDNMAGKLAVGTVVVNRAAHWNRKLFGGPTIKGVVLHKLPGSSLHQFSCVDDENLWAEEPSEQAYEAARKVLNGYRTFNKHYVYYYNPKLSRGIDGIVCNLKIGQHLFGTE